MALNPKTVATLAYLAQRYGPTVVNQLTTVLNERPSSEGAATGDPARPTGTRLGSVVESVQDAARRRTAEGRLNAKFEVLTELIRGAEPGSPMGLRADRWRTRLQALVDKRNLVVRAYTGRERAKQLRAIGVQIDEMLADFLAAADEAAKG